MLLKDGVVLPAFGPFLYGGCLPAATAVFTAQRQVAVVGRHAAQDEPALTPLADSDPKLALHTFRHRKVNQVIYDFWM